MLGLERRSFRETGNAAPDSASERARGLRLSSCSTRRSIGGGLQLKRLASSLPVVLKGRTVNGELKINASGGKVGSS